MAKGAKGGSGGGGGAKMPPKYALPGPQVEPTAGLWIDGATRICVPTIGDIRALTEPKKKPDPRFAIVPGDFPTSPAELDRQLRLLVELQGARAVSPYPSNRLFGDKGMPFRPTPLSRFLKLQPVPFGTVFDVVERNQIEVLNVLEQHLRILDGPRIVDEGRELARVFEIETPGLFHRHALNWAFFNRPDVSPPRQARVWMGLDMAIYTALDAAWYYKWLDPQYSRLLRPEEYDRLINGDPGVLCVLFDRAVGEQGQEDGEPRTCPCPSPGTPRHPAWPSGHSTYSAAASYILEYFFSPATLGFPEQPGDKPPPPVSDEDLFEAYPPGNDRIDEPGWIAAELRRLANNIGEARLWGGVHWLSDHVAGQKIGRAAAEAVARQFRADCVPPAERRSCEELKDMKPPTNAEIEAMAGRGKPCKPGQDTVPPAPPPTPGAPCGDRGASFVARTGVS